MKKSLPGLVDVQINGYAGMDFNAPGDVAGEVTRALWKEGVTSYFPTVITNAPEAIEEHVRSIARACETDPVVRDGVAGIHVEGPFISPEDGARGAHEKRFVRPPHWRWFQRWQKAAGGRIGIVTISPEYPGSAKFISNLAASGVTASIGHTAATPEQIREAIKAGARMSTHLGNGSHQFLPRHRNYLWEQLAADSLTAGVIADGFHLPKAVVKVILRAKGDRAILVSDAVYLSGVKPGNYTSPIGREVVLTREGKLHLAKDSNILAGSVQMILYGVRNLVKWGLTSFEEAWSMASTRPAKFMKVRTAGDRVVVDGFRVLEVYKKGKKVYDRAGA